MLVHLAARLARVGLLPAGLQLPDDAHDGAVRDVHEVDVLVLILGPTLRRVPRRFSFRLAARCLLWEGPGLNDQAWWQRIRKRQRKRQVM